MAGSPWSNQNVSLILLTEQATGFSGLFGYSPSIGAGNLIFSLAAVAGTDPYGNAYPQGFNITQGAISGTTFTGTNFLISSAGAFFYSGAPALGNLIAGLLAGEFTSDMIGQWPVMYLKIAILPVAAGLLLMLFSRQLKRLAPDVK